MLFATSRLLHRFRLAASVALVAGFMVCATAGAAAASLTVEPAEGELAGNLDRLQLSVTVGSSGRPVDVTRSVEYENLTPEILKVGPTGQVAPLADGLGRIRVQHGDASRDVEIRVHGVVENPVPLFREDVVPILSKAGCSQGACHAAQHGQGAFILSLFGFAPEQDHPAIVREWNQRRISLIRPEDSLLLRKAVLEVQHGGGKRFDADSFEYELLRAWLAAGAPPVSKDEPQLVDLTVLPLDGVYETGQTRQLRVLAHYSDETTRDVTHRALYDSLGEAVASVDGGGFVEVVGNGQAAIMIRYHGQAKISHVMSPYDRRPDYAGFEPQNFIDEAVLARWKALNVQPSPRCSDEEFIRRAYLDAIGTLPTPDDVARFVASDDPGKRDALVDQLLGLSGDPEQDRYVHEWSAYWALKWGDMLRINRKSVGDGGMWSFHNWVRQSLRENKPIDRFTREIITAEGSVYEYGPANYYRISRNPSDLAETTAQVFLGVRMQCAQCHTHPFEVYTQADYYGLAAFFTRVGTKGSTDFGVLGGDQVVKINSTGSIRHPRTRQVMQPKPLLGKPVDADDVRDLRKPLADWLTAPENRLFAENVANRIWGYLMGTGIVEPIDDMRATNPASNPPLLAALADHFIESGYDLKQLMRAILTSSAYQLSSTPLPENVADTRLYTHYNVKRLPAEVLLDALDAVTETQERYPGVPPGTRAIELPDPNFASYFLDTLGRPQRAITCECERTAEPNLAQVLHIANGEVINRKLGDRNGRIARLVKAKTEADEAIRELYLVALSRQPTEAELSGCRQIIDRAANYQEGLEDVLWALCNTREFLFNR